MRRDGIDELSKPIATVSVTDVRSPLDARPLIGPVALTWSITDNLVPVGKYNGRRQR
jgi:hypothetical protein